MTTHPIHQTIEYARDADGVLFAIERIRTDAWDPAYLDPPGPEVADARIVELPAPIDLDSLPAWLRIEVTEQTPLRVAEAAPAYATSESNTITALWDASPYRTTTTTSVEEYIRAAASAILAPAPAPYEAARGALTIRRYATTSALLAPFIELDSDPRERWLQRTFADAEALAYEVLIERLMTDAPEVASTLRFLRAAEIADNADYLDLAFDRRALLEQASPWRYYESSTDFAPALAAAHAWIRRYQGAYERHYRKVVRDVRSLEQRVLTNIDVAANGLRQLNALAGIGRAQGLIALHTLDHAQARLSALPSEPDRDTARTGDVTLGREHPALEDARRAASTVRDALETQRRAFAQRTVQLVLERKNAAPLDQLLDALAAANIDGIERVLDERLTAHIQQLIA